ncbi:hypothetical protein ACLB2K_064187 [Fragaria x ananassa]
MSLSMRRSLRKEREPVRKVWKDTEDPEVRSNMMGGMNWNLRNTYLLSDDKVAALFDLFDYVFCNDLTFNTGYLSLYEQRRKLGEEKWLSGGVFQLEDKHIDKRNKALDRDWNFNRMELNLSLCKMLLDNFNVKNCTIKIHWRNMSVMEKNFDRLMGLKCRGIEVAIPKRLSLDA